jgi:hypothetical protein
MLRRLSGVATMKNEEIVLCLGPELIEQLDAIVSSAYIRIRSDVSRQRREEALRELLLQQLAATIATPDNIREKLTTRFAKDCGVRLQEVVKATVAMQSQINDTKR